MAKIAVVIPYFGQLPNYFSLYLNSLKHTPYIDVLFITDIEIKENLPKNFKVIKTSLASLSDRIEKTLGIDINIKHPIKLCDFKPTWGHVFETELKGYNFWAFGDIDVVYGDVQHFLPENWQQKDIISFVPNWLSGSLCLLKNNDTMRTLYQRSEYWKEALGAADHWAFDECHHLYTQLRQGHSIDDLDDKQSFTWVVNKMQQTGEIDAYLSKRVIKEKIYLNESLRIEPGRVSQQNGENFAYYHLICEKKLMSFKLPKHQLPDEYILDRQGFHYCQDYQKQVYRMASSITGSSYFTLQQLRRGINKVKKSLALT